MFASAAIGPVELVTRVGAVAKITVLGQTYTSDTETIADIAQGDYVVVAGDSQGGLSLVYPVGIAYVPGASLVTVRGSIAAVDTGRATARVGTVLVDYSAYLATNPNYVPESGDTFEVTGTQPQPGGAVLVGTNDSAVVTQFAVGSVTASQGSAPGPAELETRF
jgi:hypothetical protein